MECHATLFEESCGCHGRSIWWIRPCSDRRILVLSPPQEKEEMLASRTSCQGHSQGYEVVSSSIAGCFSWTLLTQTKQQTSTSGVYYRSCLVEMVEEKGWFRLGHFKTEVFHPWQFLCGKSWLSTSAPITEYSLLSRLSHEADQVGAGLSCSTSWYLWDAPVSP